MGRMHDHAGVRRTVTYYYEQVRKVNEKARAIIGAVTVVGIFSALLFFAGFWTGSHVSGRYAVGAPTDSLTKGSTYIELGDSIGAAAGDVASSIDRLGELASLIDESDRTIHSLRELGGREADLLGAATERAQYLETYYHDSRELLAGHGNNMGSN
jgi:hypothetical protein